MASVMRSYNLRLINMNYIKCENWSASRLVCWILYYDDDDIVLTMHKTMSYIIHVCIIGNIDKIFHRVATINFRF